MACAIEPRWGVSTAVAKLLYEPLDDAVAIFNPETWRTHLLNGPAMSMLESLRNRGSATAEELAEALSSPPSAESLGAVRSALTLLAACGLIVPAA